jgi:hypothetical protein
MPTPVLLDSLRDRPGEFRFGRDRRGCAVVGGEIQDVAVYVVESTS